MARKDFAWYKYPPDGQVCIKFGFIDLFLSIKWSTTTNLIECTHFEFDPVNSLFIHKMVDSTKFNTNLTIQTVCT